MHSSQRTRVPCVYILASSREGALYIGVTSNLLQRVWEHKEGLTPGHASHYNIDRLVWFEVHYTMPSAIAREKALKKWNRAWKLRLIEESNPRWRDFYRYLW